MNPPCKDCLTFSICKIKVINHLSTLKYTITVTPIYEQYISGVISRELQTKLKCPLLEDYLDEFTIDRKIKKVLNLLGLKFNDISNKIINNLK